MSMTTASLEASAYGYGKIVGRVNRTHEEVKKIMWESFHIDIDSPEFKKYEVNNPNDTPLAMQKK